MNRDINPIEPVAVVPHDTNNLPDGIARCIRAGTGGDIQILTANGKTVVIPDVQDGVWEPIYVRRVFSTNTTATDILVGYSPNDIV